MASGGKEGEDLSADLDQQPHPGHQQRRREHPEPDGVDPREGHVVGPDEQREDVVPDAVEHGEDEEDQHRQPVGGKERVVGLGRPDVRGRCQQFRPEHHRVDAAPQASNGTESDVQQSDVTVVRRRQPPVQLGPHAVDLVLEPLAGDRAAVALEARVPARADPQRQHGEREEAERGPLDDGAVHRRPPVCPVSTVRISAERHIYRRCQWLDNKTTRRRPGEVI